MADGMPVDGFFIEEGGCMFEPPFGGWSDIYFIYLFNFCRYVKLKNLFSKTKTKKNKQLYLKSYLNTNTYNYREREKEKWRHKRKILI